MVFKEWLIEKSDDSDLFFEFDKKMFKLKWLVKEQKDPVDSYIRENYHEFKLMYDYYRAVSGGV